MEVASAHNAPFSSRHYSKGLTAKLRRAFGAGLAYYLRALPRYIARRRSLNLSCDWGAWRNPLREFRPRCHHNLSLPPEYSKALDLLTRTGVELAMPRMRFEALVGAWWSVRDVPGEFIECGAFEGATGLAVALLGRLLGIHQRVFLLDTFYGIPETGDIDLLRSKGEFMTKIDQVNRIETQANSLEVQDRIKILPGLFSETFRTLKEGPALHFSLAHIDANVYQGTWEACEFCVPRLSNGGVAVFDDYNGPFDLGARLAIDRFFQSRAQKPRPLAWSSAYVRNES